jgi:hypothetical protein
MTDDLKNRLRNSSIDTTVKTFIADEYDVLSHQANVWLSFVQLLTESNSPMTNDVAGIHAALQKYIHTLNAARSVWSGQKNTGTKELQRKHRTDDDERRREDETVGDYERGL